MPATPATVQWGYFDRDLPPRLVVESGDSVRIETVNPFGHAHPGFTDNAIEEIYATVQNRGPGPHLLTGPIAVAGAEPGDALEVRVLALELRQPYGVCGQTPNGLLHGVVGNGVVGTVFEIDADEQLARPLHRFRYPEARPPAEAPLDVERLPALDGLTVPLRLHLGVAGVAPVTAGRINTIAPGRFGGNIDQWRFGPGTAMTYPVLVEGALFSCGDGHLTQGDGEVADQALESHLTATLELVLHKGRRIANPRLDLDDAWVVHGFGATLDEACKEAALEAVELLRGFGLDEIDALHPAEPRSRLRDHAGRGQATRRARARPEAP